MALRRIYVTVLAIVAAGCGDDGGTPPGGKVPPSVIHDGMGWRTVATYPDEPDPAGGYFNYDYVPAEAAFIGATAGRVHARVRQKALDGGTQADSAPLWISFDATHEDHPKFHGAFKNDFGIPAVRDRGDAYYAWSTASPSLHRFMVDPINDTFTRDEVLTLTDVAPGGRAESSVIVTPPLDIAVVGDGPDSAGGIACPSPLYVRPQGASAGQNFHAERRELVLEDDQFMDTITTYCDQVAYPGRNSAGFYPTGGRPYVFELVRSPGGRRHLDVLTGVAEASSTAGQQILRRIAVQPVASTIHGLYVVTTPSNASVVLVDTIANTWTIYRFDRATATLSLESTVPAPGVIEDSVGDNSDLAVTDDGTLYAMIRPPQGTFEPPRIVRIANGQVTELWNAAIAVSPDYVLWRLFSTGARVYTVVTLPYPVTFTAGTPQTYLRPRWSFITPDIADVPAPQITDAAPEPPASCNPLAASPCPGGQVCTAGPSRNGFACKPAGTAGLCAACDPAAATSCAPGYWCRLGDTQNPNSGVCVRLCCDQADCGSPACVINPALSPVGYCGNAINSVPTCSGIPAVAPSGGSCVP